MVMQDKEMLHELILESREHLQAIEPDLLELEKKGNDVSDELINRIFRAVHSIKGGFGFFGLERVTSLSHAMEHVLSRIRERELTITSNLTDALLAGIDKLRILLDDIDQSETVSIQSELEKLKPFTDGEHNITEQKLQPSKESGLDDEIKKKHPQITRKMIVDALRNGKTLYHVMLYSNRDMIENDLTPLSLIEKWEKLGDFLDISLDISSISGLKGSSEKEMLYSVIFASVLEPDLIGIGIDVPQEQIYALDVSKIRTDIAKEQQKEPKTSGKQVEKKQNASSSSDTKNLEDSLRVKVGLLNGLMNLAGELVLSRNQLMRRFNSKLIESMDSDGVTNNFEYMIEEISSTITDAIHKDTESAKQTIQIEMERIKSTFHQILSFRLSELSGVNTALQNIDSVTSLLQENIMQTRLQPISLVFSKFPRVVRDLARKLNKQIQLELIGQDVELDKSIVELLSDPLTHLVRNCVDHGLETPSERAAAQKDPVGKITLKAFHEGGKVIVEIQDNGRGINIDKVREIAIEKGLITDQEAVSMTPREVQMLILKPGFSTASEVSDISGRGVGMDVVKSNIERLGGSIDIDSEQGIGTRILLKLPLTLAIIPSLIVSAENRIFAIPQVAVEELVRIRAFEITKKIERVQGSEVMRLRGKLLPLVRLSDVLEITPTFIHPVTGERLPDKRKRWSDRRNKYTPPGSTPPDEPEEDIGDKASERRSGSDRRQASSNAVKIVVLKMGINNFGLVVDSVYDSEEIVVKPLPEYLKLCQCYAGATIMGDGKVAMILDPVGISNRMNLRFAEIEQDTTKIHVGSDGGSEENRREILLFDNGSTEIFGIDLSTIARVEKVSSEKIERVGMNEYLKLNDAALPLIRLHNVLPLSGPDDCNTSFYVILPKGSQQPVGIAANRVHDVIQTKLMLDTSTIQHACVLGTMILQNRLTMILNLPILMNTVVQNI